MRKQWTLLLFVMSSCSNSMDGDKVKKEQLTGRYVFQANLNDTIDVFSDGSYHNYTWFKGKLNQNSGTWIYDSIHGRVRFHNFSFLTDDFGHGTWDTKIKLKGTDPTFIYATDISGGYFLRVDSIDHSKK